ncbi:uncharacterized protein LOC117299157 [Asterias rubens]|uniref:uncharacterized protein LOC117299157 n=1 Tax=Asterias rubens TaxID=7604 RepID=UPI0014552AAE|nr:uncharacterized protein LOC117299157 [Asterias rubens]
MTENDLYEQYQSAYRPLHSTETALVKVKNDIMFAFDKGHAVLLLSLDLSAAFDTIDRQILISRMSSRIGVDGIALQWFKSYIEDWTTKVEINGKSSQPSRSSIGLPQGFVFGPIGYTIYTLPVRDIARQHNIFYHTDADDIQLYITFDPKKAFSLDEALKSLSSCVVDINTWMTHNRLKLNEEKTEFLVIGSVHSLCCLGNVTLNVGSTVIVPSKSARNLGAYFDSSVAMPATQPSSFESIQADFIHHNNAKHFRIIVLYRPPPSKKANFPLSTFIDEFTDLLDSQALFLGNLIILGDFNVNWGDNSTAHSRLGDLLMQHDMQQLVNTGTHTSGHVIDLVITRHPHSLILSTTTANFISDHCAIHCQLDLEKPKYIRGQVTYRKIKTIDQVKFKQDIIASSLFSNPVDPLINQYNNVLRVLLDTHAPTKTCSIIVKPMVPWYNEDIALAKRRRRQLERRWRLTSLQVDREIYKAQRELVKVKFNNHKANYYSDKIPTAMVDSFSDFFREKIIKIRDNISLHTEPYADPHVEECEFHQVPLTAFTIASNQEVTKIIKSSPMKTFALDPIPSAMVKEHIDVLVKPIAAIINRSLTSGHFQDCLKKALITQVLKKQSLDKNNLNNFRPIYNLSFVSKVAEKVVVARFNAHLTEYGLRDDFQSAYTSFHSVETALLKVHNDIMIAIDNKRAVLLVLLDLSAAFDTEDHNILLHRLHFQFGVQETAINWFKSYLHNRTQSSHISGNL